MFDIRRLLPWTGFLGLACLALAGCAPKTGVSVTGDAPAQYTHVIVTAQEIRFNTSATAAPDDTAWIKFPLSAPVSVDLLSAQDGVLTQIASNLSIPSGSYAQVRLIPVDSSAALTSSASALGAQYNSEVDFVDTAGKHQMRLELQNPDEGIGIPTNLTITNSVSGSFGATNTSTTTTTGGLFSTPQTTTTNTTTTTSTGIQGTTTVPATTTTGVPATTTTGVVNPLTGTVTPTTPVSPTGTVTGTGTATATLTPVSLAINLDGSRDLVPFTFATQTGVLLNPHMSSFGSSTVGAIQGALTLSKLSGITESNGNINIQVTAEALSADGTRHVGVNSAPVKPDGTFIIYPLSVPSSSTATYDLVIHGPGISTIVVTGVSVTPGDPSTTTPVSIGTIQPLAASSYTVNLRAGSTLPAGSLVGFYQTLPGSNQVPYLIEERPLDPFNRTFTTDQALAAGKIEVGSFAAGADPAITSFPPTEGTGTYRVSASAPLFNDGSLTTTVSAPPANTKGPKLVSVPSLTIASGGTSRSISVDVSEASPGKYNQGEIIVSHDGAIVATAALDATLAQGGKGTIVIAGVPGGSSSGSLDAGIYFLSVRTWNSADPAGTLNRQSFPTPVDLSGGNASGIGISID
ncbi:MAG TPA: DUF4382 domain-containing protein [Steroidobacteraceae bacterium]|nr:DUF4382 domain-containing protein [Steroidobacteraceae bacterium]